MEEYQEVGVSRIHKHSSSSELQPVEWLFRYLRKRIERIVCGELNANKEVVESELRKLAGCRESVRSLSCWDWIDTASRRVACSSLGN